MKTKTKTNRNWNYECEWCGHMTQQQEWIDNEGRCKYCINELIAEMKNQEKYDDCCL